MADGIYDQVRQHYSSAAKASDDVKYSQTVAAAFGYSEEELASIPQDANLGLSCGNPLALTKVREGETVIDLGSGAGFDAFLAAKNVGPTGKVIGVDMNKDMLERANRNKESAKADNVEFVESLITDIKLADGIADCIISNCVVNLVPEAEKQLVFNEMYRLLKPGGRVALSDILTRKELTPELKQSMALYVGCIAGASRVQDYENYLRDAGFGDLLIVDTNSDLNIYVSAKDDGSGGPCCGPTSEKPSSSSSCCGGAAPTNECSPSQDTSFPSAFVDNLKKDFRDIDFNEWAGSFKIYAVKS